ncbi:unnamed protein product [Lactuca saligna]|uniref:Uncharacterized protein n=1 Tax=Lactuca saligna TaxID=75948 RepID=A0AA35YYH8_LACSI|nr:unnamed protein product [Lactuca saligna]
MLEEIRIYVTERFCIYKSKGQSWDVNICHCIRLKLNKLKEQQRAWQLAGYPCIHGYVAISSLNRDPGDYVLEWFTTSTYASKVDVQVDLEAELEVECVVMFESESDNDFENESDVEANIKVEAACDVVPEMEANIKVPEVNVEANIEVPEVDVEANIEVPEVEASIEVPFV